MELQKAKVIAEELKSRLEMGCKRIEIAGSIRRQKSEVGDIKLLVIPRITEGVFRLNEEIVDLMVQEILGYRLNKRGSSMYGEKNKLMVHLPSGIGVDIFSTDAQCWAVSLVVKTGGAKTKKLIASAARRKGWRFRAIGDGFDTPDGHISCSTEREVFEAVGLPYLPPEQRE